MSLQGARSLAAVLAIFVGTPIGGTAAAQAPTAWSGGEPALTATPAFLQLVDERSTAGVGGANRGSAAGQAAAGSHQFTMTVTGPGTVTSTPAGINCPDACTAEFPDGAAVTLTPTPGPRAVFHGWSGEDCSGRGPCVVSMTRARAVTATFADVTDPGQALTTEVVDEDGGGRITVDPIGVATCGQDCLAYPTGTAVTLTAVAQQGEDFVGWSGACVNSAGPCTVTMTEARHVIARFATPRRLTVAVGGGGGFSPGVGTITSSPTGIDCGTFSSGDCSEDYPLGATVTLTPTPGAGSYFAGWTSAGCSGAGSCTVTMDVALTVTATFRPLGESRLITDFDLGADRRGTGTIVSAPDGIDCASDGSGPGQCAAVFTPGGTVTLTATPSGFSRFDGWEGGGCAGTGPCTITLPVSSDSTAVEVEVTARFSHVPQPPRLTVDISGVGHGTVTLEPGAIVCTTTCVNDFAQGQQVTLTLAVDPGYYSVLVAPGCTQGQRTCVVTIDEGTGVGVAFERNPSGGPLLDVSAFGPGRVTSDPAGINCPGQCVTAGFAAGTVVTLIAAPEPGSVLSAWGGACSGTGPCVVTMSQARTVTATFAAIPRPTLTVQVNGAIRAGQVTSSPAGISCSPTCSAQYDQGASVRLTANWPLGYTFSGWSGAGCSGTAPCTVTMSEARAVTANFAPDSQTPVRTLTVSVGGTGSGRVVSSPAGIDCPGACSANYPQGQRITLTAIANSASRFERVVGACSSASSPCSFTLNDNNGVSASFESVRRLTVNLVGAGTGTVTSSPAGISCPGICESDFATGTRVQLNQSPAFGSFFHGYANACNGSATCVLTMSDPRTLSASFGTSAPVSTSAFSVSGIPAGTQPFDIACCDGDELIFTDTGSGRLGRVSVAGAYRGVIEPAGGPQPGLASIARTPASGFAYADRARNRVDTVRRNGLPSFRTVGRVDLPGPPRDIVVAPDDSIWATLPEANKIVRISANRVDRVISLRTRTEPSDIVVGPDLALWFTEVGGNSIGRIPTSATSVADVQEFFLGATATPRGIASGDDGKLWFTDESRNRIGSIRTDGIVAELPPLPTPNARPGAIVDGHDGALWFAQGSGAIGRMTRDGTASEFTIGAGGAPEQVLLAPNNDASKPFAVWYTQPSGGGIGAIPVPGSVAPDRGTATTGESRTQIGCRTVRLNGTVNPVGQPATWQFVVGDSEFDHTIAQSPPATLHPRGAAFDVSADITGLSPNTPYHYRLVASNGVGRDIGFLTPPSAQAAVDEADPDVTLVDLKGRFTSACARSTAYLEVGEVKADGSVAYEKESSTSSAEQGAAPVEVRQRLTLKSGVRYSYRLRVEVEGFGVVRSAAREFTMLYPAPGVLNPRIEDYVADVPGKVGAKIRSLVRANGPGRVSWEIELLTDTARKVVGRGSFDPPYAGFGVDIVAVAPGLGPATTHRTLVNATQVGAASTSSSVVEFKTPSTIDYAVAGIDVQQGIQDSPLCRSCGIDLRGRADSVGGVVGYRGVRLAAGGKPTFARVWLKEHTGRTVSGEATVKLTARLNGVEQPETEWPRARPNTLPYGAAKVTEFEYADVRSSYQFVLPASWAREGQLTLTATALPPPAREGVQCEACTGDDAMTLTGVPFRRVATQKIDVMEIGVRGVPVQKPQFAFAAARSIFPITLNVPNQFQAYYDATDEFNEARNKRGRMEAFVDIVQRFASPLPDENLTVGLYPGAYGPNVGSVYWNYPLTETAIVAQGSARDVTAIAHEVGHGLGLKHPGVDERCYQPPNEDGNQGVEWLPDQRGRLHGAAFITLDGIGGAGNNRRESVLHDLLAPYSGSGYYDLMSYCGPGGEERAYWISPEFWEAILKFKSPYGESRSVRAASAAARPAPAASAQAAPETDVLRVVSTLRRDGTAEVTSVEPTRGRPTPPDPRSGHELTLRAADGRVLSRVAVGAGRGLVHRGSSPGTLTRIEANVPTQSATAAVELAKDGTVIARRKRSANAPKLRVLAPAPGATIGRRRQVEVRWRATDADGDTLTARLQYSRDAGATWRSVYGGPARLGRASIPSRLLGRSPRAQLRLTVDDGFGQTRTTVKRLRALGAPPTVEILDRIRSQIPADNTLPLHADARDDRNVVLPSSALRWFYGDRLLAVGANPDIHGLEPGKRRIRLVARDRYGRVGQDTITVRVTAVRPQFAILSHPQAVSRRAKSVALRVASSVAATLQIGKARFAVTRKERRLTVTVKPGTKTLRLTLVLKAGKLSTQRVIQVRRR